MNCLKSTKYHYGISWDNYFDECTSIRELERAVSNSSVSLINHTSARNVTIDDDKLRFRSKKWKQLGFTQSKRPKSFGPVLNLACHAQLGIAVAGSMSGFSENVSETITKLLQRYCPEETPGTIDMAGGMINGDRGYEIGSGLFNAHQLNTRKRSSTLPFLFGNCKSQH